MSRINSKQTELQISVEEANLNGVQSVIFQAFPEPRKVLMITSIAGAMECAARLQTLLRYSVDTVPTRREGLAALRGQCYAAVIVDDAIGQSDPAGAESLRKYAGQAVMFEINFAISGVERLSRQVRFEMQRRERELALAMLMASTSIANELKDTVTGLLLQSQLALAEPGVSPQLSTKLQQMVALAGSLRHQLEQPLRSRSAFSPGGVCLENSRGK